jgi:branched-chain amino acid transport system substrate-binding protein
MAPLAYDAGKIVFEAMKRAPALDGKSLAAAIAATKDFKGATGVISINEKRDAVKSAVILEVKNGASAYVTTVDP